MHTEMVARTVHQLVENRDKGRMYPNPEYQRGEVWTPGQQKKLIDSIFRGYQLPIFYLHNKRETFSDGGIMDRLEIIDGQQRVNALHRFVKGDFRLYEVDDNDAKFPTFLLDTEDYPCPWGGKDFHRLSDGLRTKLLNAELSIALITEATDNEIRDLFVRLQSGFPLNAQEKRDSLPGQFTEFILNLGGKPKLVGNPGHPFFTDILGMQPQTDRGKSRQLAAQIAVLFLGRRKKGLDYFSDTNSREIDKYYYTQLDFKSSSDNCTRLRNILDKLATIFKDWKGPRLAGHNAIHLVLFVDALLDDYTKSWEGALLNAHGKFAKLHADATLANKNGEENDTWNQYSVRTRYGADSADNIERRHRYYSNQMVKFLAGDLTPLDPKRAFNDLERQVIYWRDEGSCHMCKCKVDWADAHVHHVKEHHDGGKTVIDNGVLVHDECHPKGQAAEDFAEQYRQQ